MRVLGLLWLIFFSASAFSNGLSVLVPEDVLSDYRKFLAGRDVQVVRDFSGPYSRRDVVEVILFQQAAYMGGLRAPIKLLPTPEASYARVGRVLDHGRATALAASVWRQATLGREDKVWRTDALIEDGQFEAGFYTTPEQLPKLLKLSPQAFRQLPVVSSRFWQADWQALEALGFSNLQHVEYFKAMVERLYTGEAAMTLAPFSNRKDLRITSADKTLVVIPNRKLTLKGSRHWVTSRQHPMGELMFIALQQGLRGLKEKGLVEQAYRQSGFINGQTASWTLMQRLPSSTAAAN